MNYLELLNPLPLNTYTSLALAVLLLPLLSFFILIFFGKFMPKPAMMWTGTGILGLATLISVFLFANIWGTVGELSRFNWFDIDFGAYSYKMTAGVMLDNNAVMMLVVVTFIAFLVHLFSQEYMKEDKGLVRYYAYLGLFAFSMLGIVLSNNLLHIFIFWELVGLSSYLLIGFWYQKDSAANASKKAFLVNKVGDLGFTVGLLILWSQFGTLDINALKDLMSHTVIKDGSWISSITMNGIRILRSMDSTWLTVAGIGLFCGAVGKSAQFPLQVWLPDAMEGPTPVSALIHAATMVAAGVYLLGRIFVLLSVDALTIVAFTGAITAFIAAYSAFVQNNIKKVLAYSTISQLGYMVMGMGVGSYDASLFHLLTHAFFKACLFLCSGSVIHAMHHVEHELHHHGHHVHFDVQDMKYMGGLRKKMKVTFAAYMVATFALAGLPFFSGFLSKDAILTGALGWGEVMAHHGNGIFFLVPALGFLTAIMTALYMGRQMFLVFFGNFRLNELKPETAHSFDYVHESPLKMQIPLILLGLLSFGFVFSLNPFNSLDSWVLHAIKIPQQLTPDVAAFFVGRQEHLAEAAHHFHIPVSIASVFIALTGLTLAFILYRPGSKYERSYLRSVSSNNFFARLSSNAWFFNWIYDRTIINWGLLTSKISQWFDKNVIDRIADFIGEFNLVMGHIVGWFDKAIVDGFFNFMAWGAGRTGNVTRSVQGGKIQGYFVWATLSVVVILIWIII